MGLGLGSAVQHAWDAMTGRDAERKQIEWELQRAKHAHQWEVEDLKAAGLNPILSSGGSGAVTGSIQPANTSQNIINGLNSAKDLVFSIMKQKNENEQTKADLNVKDATQRNIDQDTINKAVERNFVSANTGKVMAEKNLISGQIEKNKQEIQNLIANMQLTHANTELTKTKKNEIENKLTQEVKKLTKETEYLDYQMHNARSEIGRTARDLGTFGVHAVEMPWKYFKNLSWKGFRGWNSNEGVKIYPKSAWRAK